MVDGVALSGSRRPPDGSVRSSGTIRCGAYAGQSESIEGDICARGSVGGERWISGDGIDGDPSGNAGRRPPVWAVDGTKITETRLGEQTFRERVDYMRRD